MRNAVSLPLAEVAEMLRNSADPASYIADLSVPEVVTELLNVGNSIVQDLQPDTIIDPRYMMCKPFVNSDIDFSQLTVTVADLVNDPKSSFHGYVVMEHDEFYLVSWQGPCEHPLGIKIGHHTLGQLEHGWLKDNQGNDIGIYDEIAKHGSHGYAIVAILPNSDLEEG